MNCGKTRFKSERHAMSAALAASRKTGGLPLPVYKCPDCTGGTWWHLTKRRTWRKPKPKKRGQESKTDRVDHSTQQCGCGRCSWIDKYASAG